MDTSFLLQSAQYLVPLAMAVGGLCIYLFGFQSVKEPDYSYINSIAVTRKKKEKVKKNGVVQPSAKSTSPVVKTKVVVAAKPIAGKENLQPLKKVKKVEVVDDAAEIDQGDWLPAPVRGASNKKAAALKQSQSSPKKVTDSPVSGKKKNILKEVQNKEVPAEEVKEVKKKVKKTHELEEPVVHETVVEVKVKVEGKKLQTQKSVEVKTTEEESSIADNSDLWEESKSRGNKKVRARKD